MLKLAKALSKEHRTKAQNFFAKKKAETEHVGQLENLFAKIPSLIANSVSAEELTLIANSLGALN